MPTIMVEAPNLSASTKTANQLAGNPNEFVQGDSLVTVYAISSAAGVNVIMEADNDTVIDDQEIVSIGTSLNTFEHQIAQFPVYSGTRLSLFLRETAAAATTDVLLKVEITPL